jgi:ribosomal protein L7/L12
MKIVIEDITLLEVQELLARNVKTEPTPSISIHTETYALLRKLSPIFHSAVNGQKIQAIKDLRTLTGCGLKEAKDVVEGNYF